MRSAVHSDVGAEGFGADIGNKDTRPRRFERLGQALGQFRKSFSPISSAVALTALAGATLFVVSDGLRTVDEARTHLVLIGHAVVADLDGVPANQANSVLSAAMARYDSDIRATLRTQPTTLDTGAAISRNIPVPPLGILTLEMEWPAALAGVWQRGLAAYALALLLGALGWRRPGVMPSAQQRQNYQTLVSAMPLGVACWTSTGVMMVCNEQYRTRLNLEATGMRSGVTYHDAVKQLIRGGYMKLVNEDHKTRILELHRQDGSCLLIDERPLASGGFITLVSDVTEAKKADTLLTAIREEQRLLARRYHEEKLKAEAASRSKTNFLAHLSHDIRTPLNHIIGFAELMRHQTYGALGDPRYLDYVQTIKASGEGLLASFATILDLAELESGQKVLRSEPMDVQELLESSVLRFRGQAARSGVSFVIGSPCDAVLHGDKFAMQRMIGNLIDNSLRFTPAGGKVTVAAFAATDGVVIEVSDTGLGMSESRLESLQQPFALGDATFTREGIGPGLGISISRAIAELSGGRMAIDSSPALGTTVAISLPLRAQDHGVMRAAE